MGVWLWFGDGGLCLCWSWRMYIEEFRRIVYSSTG